MLSFPPEKADTFSPNQHPKSHSNYKKDYLSEDFVLVLTRYPNSVRVSASGLDEITKILCQKQISLISNLNVIQFFYGEAKLSMNIDKGFTILSTCSFRGTCQMGVQVPHSFRCICSFLGTYSFWGPRSFGDPILFGGPHSFGAPSSFLV